ncbi:hypothetical protein BDV93DRAFT_552356 [Ceratobasidium sp. AG-I]|nr:hypothetical protein BDV93DRAFT_552356 [Ceratobasidium sp. AG-I]
MSFPLVLTLALSLLSILSSGFVILKIAFPVLVARPFNRKGLSFDARRGFTASEKCYLWLAYLDVFALCIFLWQAIIETQSASPNVSADAGAATCLMVIAANAIVYTHMGRSATFGKVDYLLWAPTTVFIVVSTVIAGILVHFDVLPLMPGIATYVTVLAIGSTMSFGFLFAPWLAIRRHFDTPGANYGSWPPPGKTQQRGTFSTEDIDALKDGSSWFTSIYGSRGETMSSFSFLTTRTGTSSPRPIQEVLSSGSALLNKSPYWASPATSEKMTLARDPNVPPVRSVSALYRPQPLARPDSDFFMRDVSSRASSDFARQSADTRHSIYQHSVHAANSRTSFSTDNAKSWLTSPTQSQATLTEWSFPATMSSPSTPSLQQPAFNIPITRSLATPALLATPGLAVSSRCSTPDPFLRSSNENVTHPSNERYSPALRGYGSLKERSLSEIEQGRRSISKRVSSVNLIGWLISVWVPLGLSLPYLLIHSRRHSFAPQIISTMLMLSVTISSPLLALSLAFSVPLSGTPTRPFTNEKLPTAWTRDNDHPKKGYGGTPNLLVNTRAHTPARLIATSTSPFSDRTSPKWQPSITPEGKGKLWQALGLLYPTPRLAIMSSTDANLYDAGMDIEPPLSAGGQVNTISIPTVEIISEEGMNKRLSAEEARFRTLSEASSHESGYTDTGFNARIEVGRRHYSNLAHAQTVVITPSPTRSSFAELHPNQHLRLRPISSVSIQSSLHSRSSSAPLLQNSAPTLPPTDPLPPIPDSTKSPHTRARSSGYLLSSISNVRGLESIMPSLLPHLAPHPSPTETDITVSEDWESLILSSASPDEVGRSYMDSSQRVPRGVSDALLPPIPVQPLRREGKVPAQPSFRGISPWRLPKSLAYSTPFVPEPVQISVPGDAVANLDEISRALEEFGMKGCEDEPLQAHTSDPVPLSAPVSSLSIARDTNVFISPLKWKGSKPATDCLNTPYDSYYARTSTETASSLSVQTPDVSTTSLHNLPEHNAKAGIPSSQLVVQNEDALSLPTNQARAPGNRPYYLPTPPLRHASIAQGSTSRVLDGQRRSKEHPVRAEFSENNDVPHGPFRPLRLKGKNLASDKRLSVSSETNKAVRVVDYASVNLARRWSVTSSKRSSVTSMKLDQNGMRPLSLVKRSATRVCVDTVPEVDSDPLDIYGYSGFAAGLR